MKFVSGFPVALAAEQRAIVGELTQISKETTGIEDPTRVAHTS